MSPIRTTRRGQIVVSPDSLPAGTVGAPYRQTITASGGRKPYKFSFAGEIPSGLALSTGGVLSGIPRVAGSSSFTILVRDWRSATANKAYTVDVSAEEQPQPPSLIPVSRGHQAKIFERQHQVPITTFGRKYIPASGGATYVNAEVTAWANNVTTAGGTVSTPQGTRVDTMVSGLKSDLGISAMSAFFDRFWLFVAENTQQATYDIVGGGHTWTFNGASTFATQWAPTTGFTGDGVDNYLNSNYNPSTNGVGWTIYSAMMGVYTVGARTASSTKAVVGATNGTSDAIIYPYTASNTVLAAINGNQFNIGVTTTSAQCFILIEVYAAGANGATIYQYTSPTAVVNYGGTAAGVINLPLYIGAQNGGAGAFDFSNDSIACVYFSGAAASPTQLNAIAARINTYMSGAGAAWHW